MKNLSFLFLVLGTTTMYSQDMQPDRAILGITFNLYSGNPDAKPNTPFESIHDLYKYTGRDLYEGMRSGDYGYVDGLTKGHISMPKIGGFTITRLSKIKQFGVLSTDIGLSVFEQTLIYDALAIKNEQSRETRSRLYLRLQERTKQFTLGSRYDWFLLGKRPKLTPFIYCGLRAHIGFKSFVQAEGNFTRTDWDSKTITESRTIKNQGNVPTTNVLLLTTGIGAYYNFERIMIRASAGPNLMRVYKLNSDVKTSLQKTNIEVGVFWKLNP